MVFLVGAWQKSGDILECDNGNVERIAEADKARPFFARIDIQHTGQHGRLVGNNADRMPAQTRKADDDILREPLVDLEELAPLADGTLRSESESTFLRYERTANGWRARAKSGLLHEFGDSSPARIENNGRVFAWLLERTTDLNGNTIEYHYTSDPGSPVADLGKLSVFSGVRDFPTRVKCASLAWHTMKAAVAHDTDAPVSTE